MTIKEMEALSGMTRANIRFYEAEGLLSPVRRENGYRDYSENDLEVLKRVKLLRALRIPLEDIRALHTGEQTLVEALDRHIEKLQRETEDIAQSRSICQTMRVDGARYETLDAQRYLNALERAPDQPEVPGSDAIDEERAPFRRYFARTLDLTIYSVLWDVFLALVMNVNISARGTGGRILDILAAAALMLLCEPVLLSRFGTTAGKWVLGLRVTDLDGGRLSYEAALKRTWTVFVRGMGLRLPLYDWFRQWKSLNACADGETLDWENDSAIELKDKEGWRVAAYIGVWAATLGVIALTVIAARMPIHRGDITVAEFCENYNRLSRYYDIGTGAVLDAQGKWHPSGGGFAYSLTESPGPDFVFSEDDGLMTGMGFTVEAGRDNWRVSSYRNEMILSILSFVNAQPGSGPLFRITEHMIQEIGERPLESFDYTVCGVRIRCEVEYSGYFVVAGVLWPEGEEQSFSLYFSMEKVR